MRKIILKICMYSYLGVFRSLDKQNIQRKIVNIFIPITFRITLKQGFLTTHNISTGREIRKLNFYTTSNPPFRGDHLNEMTKPIFGIKFIKKIKEKKEKNSINCSYADHII